MDNFGTDFTAQPDLRLKTQTGWPNLREALIRRLTTPRGGLWYDPTYGTDVREWLNDTLTPLALYSLQRSIGLELTKDPRVLKADTTATQVGPRQIQVHVDVLTEAGPFKLILAINETTVEVLRD